MEPRLIDFSTAFHHPAFWGFGGAFIYAAPKLVACMAVKRETGEGSVRVCGLEFFLSLLVGAFAAGAFSKTVANFINLPDPAALAAMIGLLANHPRLVETLSSMVFNKVAAGIVPPAKKDGI